MDTDPGPKATVRQVGDQLVLDDPVALGMIQGIEKYNCRETLLMNIERVIHFIGRMAALEKTSQDVVIVILNVDDPHGGPIAEMLMPGEDWQAYRDRGEVPFARGLVDREGMQDILAHFDDLAAEKLQAAEANAIVVVVDRKVAEVFEV